MIGAIPYLTRCALCGVIAHTSETDDLDRCQGCAAIPLEPAYRDPATGFRLVCPACYVASEPAERAAMLPDDLDAQSCAEGGDCYPCGRRLAEVEHNYPPPGSRCYACRTCGDDWRSL